MTAPSVTPDIARSTWRAVEPLHSMIYFAPEGREEYSALGFDLKANPAQAYFPARAAAMGAVGPDVVTATFFNFSPSVVAFGMTGAWDVASPADLVAARFRAVDRALRRLLGDRVDGPEVAEAAELARTATQGCAPEGRPLYAAHAALDWPEQPHVALWHAQSLLREYRGDGHIAALVHQGLSGLEAAVLHVAVGDSWSRKGLQSTRGWSDAQWDGAVESLAGRGWLQLDGSFTDEGRARRQRLEDDTDRLSVPPYAHLGAEGCARLAELGTPLARLVVDAGGLGIR
ncbi:MAG: hypothetical protein JWN57_2761 [Frankiales bacterium]|nr:hypothetical protein [Frankiales bacterium]